MRSKLAYAIATVGGLGDRLLAPGTTVGSLAGLVLFALTSWALPAAVRAAALGALLPLTAIAVWACGADAARRGVKDPQPIVADEVAGQWVALTVWVTVWPMRPPAWDLVASFLLFRAFDIAKPWPIRRLERFPGGWGIVADDLAAGLAAGLVHVIGRVLLSRFVW